MFKKNDPLVEVSKKIMQENETRRQVVLLVNESLGIEDKKVLPRELFAEYDTILAEAQSVALKEGIDNIQLDEISKELNVRYRNAAMDSKVKHKRARDKLWNKSERYERKAQKAYSKGDTEGMLKLDDKRQKAHAKGNDHNRKYKNREKGQQRALDRYKGYFLTKKSYGSVNEEQLDEVSLKKAIAAYRSSSEGEHWNRNDYERNDKAANAYRKQKNKFKSYIHKKGGDKAVGDAEKGAKQDIEGKKYSSYSNDTISARKDVLDKEKKSGRWGVFSKGPKKGHLKQASEHKRYMQMTHDSVMKDAKKKVNLPESEQLDEVTIKAIVKKVANELPSRKKKIEDLNRRAMNKPTIKGWANAQKRVNAAVNEEQLDESVRTPLPKVSKKKAIKEDTSIEAINEEIYDNLLANLIEAYQSSEDAFNDMVDSLTEEQLQILGFTEGIQ